MTKYARRFSAALLVATVAASGLGCTVRMGHNPLDPLPAPLGETLPLAGEASGLSGGRVGWGRGTAFYIPVVPVHITGEGEDGVLFMRELAAALKEVGIRTTPLDAGAVSPGPALRCEVRRFWFNNYTWLFPLVPTWGTIEITAILEDQNGTVLWSREFAGSGSSLNFFDGYTSAAREGMTELLNEMARELSGEEFRMALAGGRRSVAWASD